MLPHHSRRRAPRIAVATTLTVFSCVGLGACADSGVPETLEGLGDGNGGLTGSTGLSPDGSVTPIPGATGTGGGNSTSTDLPPVGIDGCGGDRYDAETKQLDVYMIVDESASMIPWWPSVISAIDEFISSPEAAGMGVGLQLFGDACDPSFYATPKVPIGLLPDHAAQVRAGFPIGPFSGTATQPALQGAIQHARDWSASHPDSKVVVLLVTDGVPDDCLSTVEGVSQVAADGFSGSPSIPTYVVGLPLLEVLNPIAVAGGTERAYAADPTNASALVDTLNAVRGEALPCDYALPATATDPNLVNLDYRTDGGVDRLRRVDSPSACDGTSLGWFYDPENPDRIVACEATCEQLKSRGGIVDVVVGCPTLI